MLKDVCSEPLARRAPTGVAKLLAIGLGVALLLSLALASPSASAVKRPNLIVSATRVHAPQYVFKGDSATFKFSDRTANRDEGTARRSRTELSIQSLHAGANSVRFPLATRKVSKLEPDDSDPGGATETVSTEGMPLGEYEFIVCADDNNVVHESHENDNCTETGDRFYIAKELWEGSLNGKGEAGGIFEGEKWNSTDASLVFGSYLGRGVFRYDFDGTVSWTDSGVNSGGCAWNGSGSKAFDDSNSGPGIKLDYRGAKYKGLIEADDTFYTITISGMSFCNSTADGPIYTDFLSIAPGKALEFDQRSLKGKSTGPEVEWKWAFE
jgi:hypothetical protein